MVVERGRRIGFEVKFSEAPRVTKAMRSAMETLALAHLFIVCPTREACRVDYRITMLSDTDMSICVPVSRLSEALGAPQQKLRRRRRAGASQPLIVRAPLG